MPRIGHLSKALEVIIIVFARTCAGMFKFFLDEFTLEAGMFKFFLDEFTLEL
jgi:hypothetical protein